MQTGATAGGLAEEASTAAGKAMMAYMHAKAASEAAAAAEDVTAAVKPGSWQRLPWQAL